MDFRQLESFISIAKQKSFSKAAEELFITQPTISSHIQNLEKELDTVLINRSSKEITLTPAGQLFLEYALNILDIKNQAIYKLCNYTGQIEGCLEINSSTMPQQYLLPDVLMAYSKKYPRVSFALRQADSQMVVEGLLNNKIEFGIVGAKIDNSQLEYYELEKDHLVVVTPSSVILNKENQRVSVKELFNYNLIVREEGSGTRKLFENCLTNNGISIRSFNLIAQCESTEAIKAMILRGLGISILSYKAIKENVDNKTMNCYYIKEFDMERNFYFVNHRYKVLSPLATSFKSFILQKTGALGLS